MKQDAVASFMRFQESMQQTGKDAEEFLGMLVELSNYMERFDLKLAFEPPVEEYELVEASDGCGPYRSAPIRRKVAKNQSWSARISHTIQMAVIRAAVISVQLMTAWLIQR